MTEQSMYPLTDVLEAPTPYLLATVLQMIYLGRLKWHKKRGNEAQNSYFSYGCAHVSIIIEPQNTKAHIINGLGKICIVLSAKCAIKNFFWKKLHLFALNRVNINKGYQPIALVLKFVIDS